ncbi:hypothetical protein WN48_04110, partial [Eufriesea mexicana]
TRSLEEELDTWSPARVRPSVALQMKTLNNLVAGCKSRREATLIDTYRCVPRHRSTDRRVGVETLVPLRSLHLRESSAHHSSLPNLPSSSLFLAFASPMRPRSTLVTLHTWSHEIRRICIDFPTATNQPIYLRAISSRRLRSNDRFQFFNRTAAPRFFFRRWNFHPGDTERPIKEDNKSLEKDMSKHDSGTVSRPIIHWLKPDSKQLMRSAYRRVRGDHSRWTGIIIRQRLPIGETSVGVVR